MIPKTDAETPSPSDARKPRLPLLFATAFGLGYLPKAPGTFGSLAGLAITWLTIRLWYAIVPPHFISKQNVRNFLLVMLLYELFWAATIALLGVRTSSDVAAASGVKDPQNVVIDEVSGQQLALALGFGWVNWKYYLLGFILFRVFDIWKPFPVHQMESLPGGWGIMADDWVAAVYAALGLWIAWAAGL